MISEFKWTLVPELTADEKKTILKPIPFKDSGYEASSKLLELESVGKETSTILLQATEVGRVKVSARYVDSSSVPVHTVSMSVIEPLELSPFKELYVAPYTLFSYKLMTYQRRLRKQIEMPNSQYVWSSSNSAIAEVDSLGTVKTNAKLGYALVQVQHQNLEDSVTRGGVTVVAPARLGIRVRPVDLRDDSAASTRYLVHEASYLLEIDLFDADGHKMDQFDGSVDFDLVVDASFVKIVRRETQNVWVVVGTTIGTATVSVTLTRVGHKSLGDALPKDRKLALQTALEVTSPICLNKASLALPVGHIYRLVATGGTGTYSWSSTDRSVVSVGPDGVVSVVLEAVPEGTESATVYVSDEKDPFNRVSLPVTVAGYTALGFAPGTREAELETTLVLPLDVSFNSTLHFDNCSALPIRFNATVADVFSDPLMMENACPSGCACVALRALQEGQTRFSASLPENQLSASVSIAAFRPLVVSPDRILVSLESSFDIVISGGPHPWQSQHIVSPTVALANPTANAAVSIVPLPAGSEEGSGAAWSFRLTCHEIGSQAISVSQANPASHLNPSPFVATRQVSFECHDPAFVFVAPVTAAVSGNEALPPGVLPTRSAEGQSACSSDAPYDLRNLPSILTAMGSPVDPFKILPTRYRLRNSRLVLFEVSLLDASGRVFDNFTSLALEWTSSNVSLLSFGPDVDPKSGKSRRLTRLAEKEGTSVLSVSVRGYDKASAASSRGPWKHPIAKDFDVSLVHNVRVIPPKLSLYSHPDNKVRLFSIGGSGYTQLHLNDSNVASVTHALGSGEIMLAPKTNGVLKITVVDLCLVGSDPATAIVHVSNVASIRLKSRDMLKLGDQMPLQVELLDSFGSAFDSSQLKWIDLKIHVDGTALEILPIGSNVGTQYTATGKHLGVSTISVSAVDPVITATVSSAPLQIHVFPPFQVSPAKLELMPGANFQLAVSGGPPFRSEITFEVANDSIATVSKDGFVTAQGLVNSARTFISVTIWSRVQGADPQEKPQRAGSAVVEVEVHHLRGVRIQVSSSRLLAGQETTLRVEGLDGESPFAWGGLDVNFKWEVINPDVVSLAPIFESANVTLDEEHGFTVRCRGMKPGSTRISVRVNAGPASLTGKAASTYLEVIPHLVLSGQRHQWDSSPQGLLLLAPGASYAVAPNIGNNVVKYAVLSDAPCSPGAEEPTIVRLDERHSGSSLILQSTGLAGQALLHAKDRTDGQVAVLKVAVKPVYHVELRPRLAAQVASPLSLVTSYRFPVGTMVDFDIVLRDEIGQEFDSFVGQSSGVGAQFEATINRPDLVSVEILRSNISSHELDGGTDQSSASSLLRIRGLRPGKATIALKLVQPSTIASSTTPERNLQFFQLIRVANAIVPMRPVVHSGGSISFNTTFARDRSYKRVWSSSNDAVLSIDSESGVAHAHTIGSANIYHNSSVYTVTQARVVRVALIDASPAACSTAFSGSGADAVDAQNSCTVPLRCQDVDGTILLDATDQVRFRFLFAHYFPVADIDSERNPSCSSRNCTDLHFKPPRVGVSHFHHGHSQPRPNHSCVCSPLESQGGPCWFNDQAERCSERQASFLYN